MGSRSPKEKRQLWGLSGPLKSIASHCRGLCSKKSITASPRLLRPSELTGVTLTFPHKKSAPCDAAARQFFFTICLISRYRDSFCTTTRVCIVRQGPTSSVLSLQNLAYKICPHFCRTAGSNGNHHLATLQLPL